jgi:cell division septation protein DedD
LRRKLAIKIFGLMITAALAAAVLRLHAQDAAPPSVDLYEEQDELEPTPTPSPVPPNGPELPEVSQLDQTFKQPRSLGPQADELRVHKEWRDLKNRTVNDPAVQAAKAYAQSAPTDLEKRNRLNNYYNIYYERMTALATTPELKSALPFFKADHQALLAQPRVRPTPDTSTPSPTPSVTPTPWKPGKHKKKEKRKRF